VREGVSVANSIIVIDRQNYSDSGRSNTMAMYLPLKISKFNLKNSPATGSANALSGEIMSLEGIDTMCSLVAMSSSATAPLMPEFVSAEGHSILLKLAPLSTSHCLKNAMSSSLGEGLGVVFGAGDGMLMVGGVGSGE
jgi:hypothetical protein